MKTRTTRDDLVRLEQRAMILSSGHVPALFAVLGGLMVETPLDDEETVDAVVWLEAHGVTY